LDDDREWKMQVAYSNKDRREQAVKARKRRGEAFALVGRIEKSHSIATAIYVSHWRGDTTLELRECERLLYDFHPVGTCIFIDIKHIDELIALLEQARQAARFLSSQK
jgi:hypothetical protein